MTLGVGEQVPQYLADPEGVAQDGGGVAVHGHRRTGPVELQHHGVQLANQVDRLVREREGVGLCPGRGEEVLYEAIELARLGIG